MPAMRTAARRGLVVTFMCLLRGRSPSSGRCGDGRSLGRARVRALAELSALQLFPVAFFGGFLGGLLEGLLLFLLVVDRGDLPIRGGLELGAVGRLGVVSTDRVVGARAEAFEVARRRCAGALDAKLLALGATSCN